MTLPVEPAFMPALRKVMPMSPYVRRCIHTGHVHHPGRRRRGVNHTGRRGINHWAGKAYLRMNRELADARVNNHRRLHKNRMGTAHLGQAQRQTAHEQGFVIPIFFHQRCHVDSCERGDWPKACLHL
jgi:hypothetical protein